MAALLILSACSSGDDVPNRTPDSPLITTTSTTVAEVTVRGVVGGVFASARVVSLGQPVNGVANIALTDQTEIVRANGSQATLTDIAPGMAIEATGRPSPPDTLVARRLVLP